MKMFKFKVVEIEKGSVGNLEEMDGTLETRGDRKQRKMSMLRDQRMMLRMKRREMKKGLTESTVEEGSNQRRRCAHSFLLCFLINKSVFVLFSRRKNQLPLPL